MILWVLYRGSKQKSSIWASRFLAVTVMMVWMFCSLMIVNTWWPDLVKVAVSRALIFYQDLSFGTIILVQIWIKESIVARIWKGKGLSEPFNMHSIHWIYGSQRGFQCSAMTRFMFGPPCPEYICANGVEYIPGKSKLQNKQTKFKRTRSKRSITGELKRGLDELLELEETLSGANLYLCD